MPKPSFGIASVDGLQRPDHTLIHRATRVDWQGHKPDYVPRSATAPLPRPWTGGRWCSGSRPIWLALRRRGKIGHGANDRG